MHTLQRIAPKSYDFQAKIFKESEVIKRVKRYTKEIHLSDFVISFAYATSSDGYSDYSQINWQKGERKS